MAKKTQQEVYSEWQGKIKAALKFRDTIINAEDFKTYSNYYKGRFNKEKKKTDRIEVNKVYSTTTVMTGSLVFNEPWIAFKARKDEYKSRETLCEEALNSEIKDITLKTTVEDATRDSQLFGYSIGKCGYNLETKEEKGKVKDNQGEISENNLYIEKESVYCNNVESRKILFDPTAVLGLKDTKYVVEVCMQSKQYLESTYGVDLSKIAVGIPAFLKDKFDDLDKETQKIFDISVFYEIWDKVNKKRKILIEGYTEEVFDFVWPKGLTDEKTGAVEYPYEDLIFNRAPGEPYGISDVSLYRTQQEEINVLRSMEAEANKVNSPRWQGVEEGVTPKEVRKFLANVTGSVTMVKQANAIAPIQPNQFATDFDRYEGRIVNDIKDTLGVTDAMGGGQASGGKKTATEAYSTDFFARLRLGKRQDKVDDFVIRVGRKLFRIMQREYDTEHFIGLVGPEGKYISEEYTKKNLEGEYDLSLQQGTGAQNKGYMAQLVGTGLEMLMGNPLVNPKEYTDIIIDTYLEGVDTSKLLIPNAEEIANDPIAREKWRQVMLTVQQSGALRQATAAASPAEPPTMAGGSPQPGAPIPMPTGAANEPKMGGGAGNVAQL